METTLSLQTTDVREYRRVCAWNLFPQGLKQCQIAVALGVSAGAISQWLKAARTGGLKALRAKKAPGATPRLTKEQLAQLPALLAKGAEHYGFRGNVWTRARVEQVIAREFGVCYHVRHLSRLLKKSGDSRQKPARRARQRKQAAIKEWQEERWPALKKVSRGRAYACLCR
jgi:transposase